MPPRRLSARPRALRLCARSSVSPSAASCANVESVAGLDRHVPTRVSSCSRRVSLWRTLELAVPVVAQDAARRRPSSRSGGPSIHCANRTMRSPSSRTIEFARDLVARVPQDGPRAAGRSGLGPRTGPSVWRGRRGRRERSGSRPTISRESDTTDRGRGGPESTPGQSAASTRYRAQGDPDIRDVRVRRSRS